MSNATRTRNVFLAVTDDEITRIDALATAHGLSRSGLVHCVILGAVETGGATLDRLIERGEQQRRKVLGSKALHKLPQKPGLNYREKVFPAISHDRSLEYFERSYFPNPDWVMEKFAPNSLARDKGRWCWWHLRKHSWMTDNLRDEYLRLMSQRDVTAAEAVRDRLLMAGTALSFNVETAMRQAHQVILAAEAKPDPKTNMGAS